MGDDVDEFVRNLKRVNRRIAREDEAHSRRMEADLDCSRSRRLAPLRREDDPLFSDKKSIGASIRKHTFGDSKPQKPLLSVFFKSEDKGAHDSYDRHGGRGRGPSDSRRRRGNGNGNWNNIDSLHSSSRQKASLDYEDDDYCEDKREKRGPPRHSHTVEDEEGDITPRTRRCDVVFTRHEARGPPRSRMRDEIEEEAAQEAVRRRERRAKAEKKAAEEDRLARHSGHYTDDEKAEAQPRRPKHRPPRDELFYEEEERNARRARAPRPGGRDYVEEAAIRSKERSGYGMDVEEDGEIVMQRQRSPVRDEETDYEVETVAMRKSCLPRRSGRSDAVYDREEEEEVVERRQRPASDLPPRPPRRSGGSGGGGYMEDEYAEAPRLRPRPRHPIDDYEEAERASRRCSDEPPRRSRIEPEARPPRGERLRRLKEVQVEHRKKVEIDAAAEPDCYEEDDFEVTRMQEPPLPSRASRSTPAVSRRECEYSDEDETATPPLPSSRVYKEELDDGGPQFRLPQPVASPRHIESTQRRSLVQSAQRFFSPYEVEENLRVKEQMKPYVRPRLGTPTGLDEEAGRQTGVVTDSATRAAPQLPSKPSIKPSIMPKPKTGLLKEEEDDDTAFLSAARAKLRDAKATPVPNFPPPRSSRSQFQDLGHDFVPPKLKPTTARKLSETKPTEAVRKLAELRATKPIWKPEEKVPEALEKRAALKPPKPVTKASVPKPEAAEVLSRLKPRSTVSYNETGPYAEALTAQLRQLKPRSSVQDSSNENLEPRVPNRADSAESVDSLHHPTKGRCKGPKRRLPTQ